MISGILWMTGIYGKNYSKKKTVRSRMHDNLLERSYSDTLFHRNISHCSFFIFLLFHYNRIIKTRKEEFICQVLEVQEEDMEAAPVMGQEEWDTVLWVTGQEEWDAVLWVTEADTCHHLPPAITDTVIDPIAEDTDAVAA